jgi:hypothetical protein
MFAGGQENIEAVAGLFDQIRQWGQAAIEAGSNVSHTVDVMQTFRDSLISQLQSYGFNRTAILELVSALGLADAQLAAFERTLTTLNAATAEGRANRDAIVSSFEAIRAWGEEALRAGRSAAAVTDEIQRQRDALIAELTTRGFNAEAIRNIVAQLGLSNAALAQFERDLITLNTATLAGAQNRIRLLEQFQGIRDFAQQMIAAGIPIADVLTNIRTMRDQIVNQAVAFGFNREQVLALVQAIEHATQRLHRPTQRVHGGGGERREGRLRGGQGGRGAREGRGGEGRTRGAGEGVGGVEGRRQPPDDRAAHRAGPDRRPRGQRARGVEPVQLLVAVPVIVRR